MSEAHDEDATTATPRVAGSIVAVSCRFPAPLRDSSPRAARAHAARGAAAGPAARLALCAVVGAALVASGAAPHAAEIEGVHFDDAVEAAGHRLALNGVGLREVYIVKTWVAALYTPRPVRDARDLVSDPAPRRIAITLLADVSPDHVARSILDALQRSHDPLLLATVEAQIEAFVATVRSIGASGKGDTFTLDMIDGATRIGFNGTNVGQPIAGLLFRDALLRAFVSEMPAGESLGHGLLDPLPTPESPVPPGLQDDGRA